MMANNRAKNNKNNRKIYKDGGNTVSYPNINARKNNRKWNKSMGHRMAHHSMLTDEILFLQEQENSAPNLRGDIGPALRILRHRAGELAKTIDWENPTGKPPGWNPKRGHMTRENYTDGEWWINKQERNKKRNNK